MDKNGSLNMGSVGPLKMYSRKSKSMKKARLDINEQKDLKEKEENTAVGIKVDMHSGNLNDQVTTHDGSNFVGYGVDIVGDNSGQGFSGILSEKMESFTAETSSVGDDHFLDYSVVQVEENLKKPPKKRRRVPDREDMCTKNEGDVLSKMSTVQAASVNVKFDNHGVNLGTEQKGKCVFEMPNEVNNSNITMGNSGIDCRKLRTVVEEVFRPEEGNAMKVPEKIKRGADGDMVAVLSSPEKCSTCSKLRPRKMSPSFQKIELNEKDFERIVGKRLKVYWSGSRKWFVGRIRSYDHERKLHRVLYDDGEQEDLDLKKEHFQLEVTRDEGFKLCSKLRPSLEENNINPGGGEIIEMKDNNGSLDVAHLKPVIENVSITQKQVAEVAIEGTFSLQGGKDTDRITENTNHYVDVRSVNNEDQVTNSKNTYWYMYGEFSTEMKKNSSLDGARIGQLKEKAGMDEMPGSEERFQLQGRDTVETEDLVDVVINVQPIKNEYQVGSPGGKLQPHYLIFAHHSDDSFSNLNLQFGNGRSFCKYIVEIGNPGFCQVDYRHSEEIEAPKIQATDGKKVKLTVTGKKEMKLVFEGNVEDLCDIVKRLDLKRTYSRNFV